MIENIPDNWAKVALEDCVQILDSQRIPVNGKERQSRIEGKRQEELFPYYGATGQVGYIDNFIFEGEHLLIGEDGAPFFDKSKNVAYIAKGKFWVNNHAHILNARKGVTSNKYLLHSLNNFNYKGFVGGTTRLKLNQANLKKMPVPLAPPEQQKRIVAKIEELFSHIDAGIEGLKKAKQLLKQYRQSVLKAAVIGELTRGWREQNKGKLETASKLLDRILAERRKKWEQQQIEQFKAKGKMPKDDKWKGKYKDAPLPNKDVLPKIPESWQWVALRHVFDVITDGDHQAPPKSDKGVPFLVIGNVNKGVLDFGGTRFVPKTYFDGLAEVRIPRKGNLLYTVVGSYGIPVKVDTDKEFCVQRHIAILKPPKAMDVDYLFYVLSSGFVFKQATDVSTGTAQRTVPLGSLREIKIPLPPISEQLEIAKIVDAKSSAMSRLSKETDQKILKVEKNKQSILASAFSGKLVQQEKIEPETYLMATESRGEYGENV